MMRYLRVLIYIPFLFSCNSSTDSSKEKWQSLWNGEDFTGWHTYLGTPYQLEADSLGNPYQPFGIDNDPLSVISVVHIDEAPAIRISGVAWGMIYTEDSYKNYHLKLQVKWGSDKHPPRENAPRDSGLLYHGFGEPGSAYNWMGSQELQIQEGDMGDYWPVGEVEIDVPSSLNDSLYYRYNPKGDLRTYYFAEILPTSAHDSLSKRRVLKSPDTEKPHGEWNDVELIVYGDSSIHVVNEKVVMRLYNSRKMNSKERLDRGKIILQSEGAEVFYRDIYIQPISEIPAPYQE